MSASQTDTVNPAYKLWKRQDSFILHGIIGSVSANLSSLVSATITSHEAWTKLQKTYANRSRTRMLGLRDKLIKTRKDNSSIDVYMQAIKRISDDLALIGHPLNDDELIIHVLNGLGSEFKELCVAIRARDSPISFEELHDKLLDQKTSLKCDEPSIQITAQFNQKTSNGNHTNKSRQGSSNGPYRNGQNQQRFNRNCNQGN